MGFDICYIPVATIAGVGSMNGLGKLPFADFFVTTQTFRIVNTFITVFPTFDDEFFYLFPSLRGLGTLCRFRTLFFRSGFYSPQNFCAYKERDRDDEKNKDGSFELRFHSPPKT
jgi:hypothetical protein